MRRGSRAVLAVVAALALTVSGCGGDDPGSSAPTAQPGVTGGPDVTDVPADAETQPTEHSGDSADDPAVWVNEADPAQSLVIGNDKQGALETYDLDGSLVQRITAETKFWGNVDVRQDVALVSGPTDVVAVANAGLRLYTVDPTTRQLSPITAGGDSLDTKGGEGLCLYDSPDGDLSVFMVNISGATRQYVLEDDGTGELSLDQEREFEVGSEAEGCVVDDENRTLYLAEENVGLWTYDADPDGGAKRVLVDGLVPEGHQTADVEGVTMVDDGDGQGLVFTSSQGQTGDPSYFSSFDRATGAYRGSFRIVDGEEADGCAHTDGITATATPLGPDFPEGVFVCQDDQNTEPGEAGNQDFTLTRLEKVRP